MRAINLLVYGFGYYKAFQKLATYPTDAVANTPSSVAGTQKARRVDPCSTEIAKSPDHSGDKGAQRGFLGGNGKGDGGGARQEFPDMLNGLEL